jgi:hypothetical protein
MRMRSEILKKAGKLKAEPVETSYERFDEEI